MTSVTKNKPNKKSESFRFVLDLHFRSGPEHQSIALKLWISFRPISTCQLNALPRLHLTPIYLILSKGSV